MKKEMARREATWQLEELAYEIYEKLDEMKAILEEVAPEELEVAQRYWMAHIDGALFNQGGWLGGSYISLADTLARLKEEEEELDQ